MVKSRVRENMKKLVFDIVENSKVNCFEFNRTALNPVKHLKELTKLVPNVAGLYLVFCREDKLIDIEDHLNFVINNENYVLTYFGKAGGVTKDGRILKQGLNGRINNVVSDSHRNLKDIKRATYWNLVMTEFNIDSFYVIYKLDDNPQFMEECIYSFLDDNNLGYPIMNKKRGRIKK